jgi:hypothetical protein
MGMDLMMAFLTTGSLDLSFFGARSMLVLVGHSMVGHHQRVSLCPEDQTVINSDRLAKRVKIARYRMYITWYVRTYSRNSSAHLGSWACVITVVKGTYNYMYFRHFPYFEEADTIFC